MSEYEFKQVNFDNPSFPFILEDSLKGLIGEPLLYKPYFTTFGLKGDETVLDFGCGGGVGSRCLLKFLTRRGYLTCVDISNFWIDKAAKRLKKYANIECKSGDIRELDIPESAYDVVSVFHVIHDIAPVERKGIVNSLSRKLKVKGTLFMVLLRYCVGYFILLVKGWTMLNKVYLLVRGIIYTSLYFRYPKIHYGISLQKLAINLWNNHTPIHSRSMVYD